MTNKEETENNEISQEERNTEHFRRDGDGEALSEWNREQDRRYLEEFEKVFSEGDERDGSGLGESTKEPTSSEWDSEYDGYEEW